MLWFLSFLFAGLVSSSNLTNYKVLDLNSRNLITIRFLWCNLNFNGRCVNTSKDHRKAYFNWEDF